VATTLYYNNLHQELSDKIRKPNNLNLGVINEVINLGVINGVINLGVINGVINLRVINGVINL
jgi:hypothetical protein